MPNPEGVNNLQRDPVHGQVKRMTQLQRSAPMSGAPTPALNAPKRAQRGAVRGQRASAQGAAPAPLTPPTQAPYPTELAMVYQQIAAEIDDPLVKYYADLAARHAAGA